jgi:hypothetical protein
MTHTRIRLIAGVLASLLVAAGASAGNRAGTVTAQFLKIPINARATAMGNAQVALGEGASSIPYNPAGTLSVKHISFGGTYNMWWADIQHSFFGIAANLQDLGTVGFGVTLLTTDDMNVTTPAFPEGTGELFKATDIAFTVTYARQISEEFGLGLSAKYIRSNIYNDLIKANAVAFDIGTLYDIPVLRTRLGISVNHLGKDLLYLAFQIGRPNDANEQYNLGAEYVFRSLVALRGGYRFNHDTETFSGGLGVDLSSLGLDGKLDYAYTDYRYLPGTHMMSIEIGF